jgi:S1-C subfamily serine protease
MRKRPLSLWHRLALLALAALAPAALIALWPARAQTQEDKSKQPLHKKVVLAEKKRVEVINKVKPSVVAVMARRGGAIVGNGSGVLIDADGYALTNWHVTNAAGSPLLKCGLPDGQIYDAVLVGLDKVGDVALIKLLPKKPGDKFPFAKMGDSDQVKAGDWSLAMGNPFSLATDFTPTVTFGLISGVHRYQYPAGTLLEYTDCIQIDTSINPGNSGGPLFNMEGELIGINGRGSFEKRGRVNSGVGYAISINQIKNFMGHLRVGLDTDHASLGARMESEAEDANSRIIVQAIIDSDARRRGLDVGDTLVNFAGRPMSTVNQFKNVLGLYPRGWRVPVTYRREKDSPKIEVLVRLMGVQRGILDDKPPVPKPGPGPRPPIIPIGPGSPAAKFYKAKAGFANYHFNEVAQKRLLDGLAKNGDFSKATGDWTITIGGKLSSGTDADGKVTIQEKGAKDGKSPKIDLDIGGLPFPLEPLNPNEKAEEFTSPPDSGGLTLALFLYRQLLVYGDKGNWRDFAHGGVEPYYPPTGKEKPDYAKIRVLAEVIRGKYAGMETRWFFASEDDRDGRWKAGQLIGFEVTPDKDQDPCEVCLSNYKDVGNGRKLPSKMHVRRGGKPYGDLTITGATIK